MQAELLNAGDSRTLLIDLNVERGRDLVEELNRTGFRTDLAMSWGAGRAVLAVDYYHSCVAVADLDKPTDLEHLKDLRGVAPRVWTIVLSDREREQPELALPACVDALLSTPFSVYDLASRLAEFASHMRPNP